MIDDPNDSLDDLIGERAPTSAKPLTAPPASYKPADFSEPCKKCCGSGNFIGRNGRVIGRCFTCKGVGKQTFATSMDERARNRARAEVRKAEKKVENIEAFKTEHPDIWAWMDGSTFPPAVSMREAVMQYGSLLESRLAAAHRFMAQRSAAHESRVARIEGAPIVDSAGVDRLKAAFDSAIASAAAKGNGIRLRRPKITIGNMVISPAKETSKNPGALYVKSGQQYLGKIAGGKFVASRECSADQTAKVLAFVADPAAAAKAYGQETGVCCICNATLISKWRLLGIGPICSQKFGW